MKLTPENNWLCLYCSHRESVEKQPSSLKQKDTEKPSKTPEYPLQTAKVTQARIDQLNKQYAEDFNDVYDLYLMTFYLN